jgi:hypothetical protein
MALNAYRHVLRSARIAFETDLPILTAAKEQARAAFRQNASLPKDDPLVPKAIAHAEEVAVILKQNIVQGKNIGGDRYSTFYHSAIQSFSLNAITNPLLELRIHEHTERGDNDSIKMPNGQKVVIDGQKCCSS